MKRTVEGIAMDCAVCIHYSPLTVERNNKDKPGNKIITVFINLHYVPTCRDGTAHCSNNLFISVLIFPILWPMN